MVYIGNNINLNITVIYIYDDVLSIFRLFTCITLKNDNHK